MVVKSMKQFEKTYFPAKTRAERLAKMNPAHLGKHLAKRSLRKTARTLGKAFRTNTDKHRA